MITSARLSGMFRAGGSFLPFRRFGVCALQRGFVWSVGLTAPLHVMEEQEFHAGLFAVTIGAEVWRFKAAQLRSDRAAFSRGHLFLFRGHLQQVQSTVRNVTRATDDVPVRIDLPVIIKQREETGRVLRTLLERADMRMGGNVAHRCGFILVVTGQTWQA